MSALFARLWDDDQGAIISVELVLVLAILVFGIIPGLVALRNSVIAALGTIGNALNQIVPSFTFSGYVIFGASSGNTIAVIQGYQLNSSTANVLTSTQVPPIVLGTVVILSPAP
jgi:Flp pilus assembly pilin Flp